MNKPIQFLADPSYFWGIAIGTGLLKDIGWGAILYLAAIAGVDQSLYEAAAIDGAGRFKRMLHITIPWNYADGYDLAYIRCKRHAEQQLYPDIRFSKYA